MLKKIEEYIDIIKDSLKKEYLKDPKSLWVYPCVALVKGDGNMGIIDGQYPDNVILPKLKGMMNDTKIIIVGRMVVKYGTLVDPTTNQRMIKEKAIMIMGKELNNNRTRLVIIPCKEHKDYRDEKTIVEEVSAFDPSIKNPDISKQINDEQGNYLYYLTARFGSEQVMDTKDGYNFLLDPLIQSIDPDKIKEENIEDISDPENKLK